MASNSASENRNDFQQLLENYRNLRAGNLSHYIDEETFESIIDYYCQRGQNEKALEAVQFAINQFPYSSILLLKKADLLIIAGNYDNALEILDQSSLLDPNDVNLYILKTDVYLATDQPQKAIDLLESVISNFEGDEKIELLFELADVYDDAEKFDYVFDCLVTILKMDNLNEEALYKICFWADYTKRNEDSIKIHLQIIDENPYCELAWFNLGSAYQGLKLYEKAIDAYQYVLVIDEKFDYAYRNIGDALIRLKKYKDAIENLLKVLEIAKPEEVIFEAIAFCYEKLKQPADARFYYKKAMHLNLENSMHYYKIACTYMQQSQWRNAAKTLEIAIKIKPKSYQYHFEMAQCYFQLDEYTNAIEYLNNALYINKKTSKIWELTLICLFKIEAYNEGLKYLELALTEVKKPLVFEYYKVAFLFELNYTKEAFLQLEGLAPFDKKYFQYLVDLCPKLLLIPKFIQILNQKK